VWDRIDVRLLPDRGFDCFGAWYRGVPLHWVSALGECGRISDGCGTTTGRGGSAAAWSPPAACATWARRARAQGMHGEISHRPARDLMVERLVTGDAVEVRAAAVVRDASALGEHLELRRTSGPPGSSSGSGRSRAEPLSARAGPSWPRSRHRRSG
jgi:Domain of unknown function (DUF4432)